MTDVLVRVSLAVGLAAFVGCQQQLPEFASKTDKFKVRFGGEPRVAEKTVGDQRNAVYTLETPDGSFTVAVIELPARDNELAEMTSRYLNLAKEDIIRGTKGTLTSDSPTTLGGKYPGREFTASITKPTNGLLRARVWLVGTRLYQVMVIGTDSYANSKDSTAFLDSFQLTE